MQNNNIDYKLKVPFQAQSPSEILNPQAALPAMQGDPINAEKIKQSVNDSYVTNRAAQVAQNDQMKQLAISVPIWYGLCQSMDLFAKKCRGDYDKTIQHKMGAFGDGITNTFKSIIGESRAESVNKNWKTFTQWLGKKTDNSAILRAMKKTPSRPELAIVEGQANGMIGMQLFDYPNAAQNFVKPLKYADDLDCYGADKNFIRSIKESIKNAPNAAAKAEILQKAEFTLLSENKGLKAISDFSNIADPKAKADILKNLKAKAFGFNDVAHMEKLIKDIQKDPDEIIKVCQKANKNMYSKIWSSDSSWWGKVKGHFFGRKVYASEFTNKLIGSKGMSNPMHKSVLGKILPKFTNFYLEGATNRVAGGKLVAAVQAYFLAEAVIKTMHAEKGEKIATFTERFTEMVAALMAIPIAIQLMHKAGGVQYAGMDKAAVEAYRTALKGFNERALLGNGLGGFKDIGEYTSARDEIIKMLKTDTKNPLTKFVKKLGRIINVGNEQFRPYYEKALTKGFWSKFKDVFRNPKYWFKNAAGYPVRFLIPMLMIMPFLNKIAVKFNHAIFGRPKHSVLDKEEEVKPEGQQVPPQVAVAQAQALQAQHASETNLLNMLKNQNAAAVQTPIPQPNQAPQVPYVKPDVYSSESNLLNPVKYPEKFVRTTTTTNTTNNINNQPQAAAETEPKKTEPVRKYIPSPVGVQGIPAENADAATAAMKRSEAAEKLAMDMLSMK